MQDHDATLVIDGRSIDFAPGETVLEVASRSGIEIPALCHDPRLDPVGACRTCLVEVAGQRRLAPACMTRATADMAVTTESARVDRHRRSLLALYLTDHAVHPSGSREGASNRPNELLELAARYDAPTDWGHLESLRGSRADDPSPYVHFDAERCILCARCTRYCDEVEAVSAITLSGRAAETTISTTDGLPLLDTTCEFCGGCIDTCPTGAMSELQPRTRQAATKTLPATAPTLEVVRTTCNYCGVGCQLDLHVDRRAADGRGEVVLITSPEPGTTTNDGNLCVKGRFAYEFIGHPERLSNPLVRGTDGELHEASWDDAIRLASEGLAAVAQRHGADALGFVSSSRCTMEENYLVQKLARAAYGTNNVHQCAAT